MKNTLIFLLLWLFLLPATQSAETDAGFWATANLNKPVAERWQANLQIQSRMVDGVDMLERYLLRPSLDYLVNDILFVSLGYDIHFVKTGTDSTEQRLWQQLVVRQKSMQFKPLLRIRLEERFFDGRDDTGFRGRLLAGVSVPTGNSWIQHFVIRNEIFLNINDVRQGPKSGFDQNRFFAGFSTVLGQGFSGELGYQNQYINRASNEDLSINQLYFALSKRLQ